MNDVRRPDQVIPPRGEVDQDRSELTGEILGLVPNLVRLLYRLVRDRRVPTRAKLLLGGALAYVITPIDLIPDSVPVVGALDDIFILAMALDKLIDRAGEEVVLEHWEGSRDLLELVGSVLGTATDVVPAKVRKLLDAIG